MNNPFDYVPDESCREAFRALAGRLETLKGSLEPADINFCRELESGKMLGVLIATDTSGKRHTLYAFSGQLGDGGFHYPGFVGPVFDYLQPDGYFKAHEAEISQLNDEITRFEDGPLSRIRLEYERVREHLDALVSDYKEKCRRSKQERDIRRGEGTADDAAMADMIRRSQFEKAELHRLKKRASAELAPYEARLKEAEEHLGRLRDRRRRDSEALQQWLFSNFRLLNARGRSRSLSEIFADTPMRVPPSGAGECCAPKLLHAAYLRGWHPLAIAEYWYGAPKGGEVRIHGHHYPACRGKCLPVLTWMLDGLEVTPSPGNGATADLTCRPEIIFENEWFCVVNKPSGMLSVPGKGAALSLQEWLARYYGPDKDVRVAHRLDQDTSGLIVAAFGPESHKALQSLFATRRVLKTYEAVLDGDLRAMDIPSEGRVDLPMSPDWLDRPRQRVDLDGGRPSLTEYSVIAVEQGRTRVSFRPLTGRTHQLRVHSASPMGLGVPIVGDRLYGDGTVTAGRLHLHARALEFTFPMDGRCYTFTAPVPF